MPGWHAKTKQLAASGDLQVIGIAQEQHADRTQLFMQWHNMDWPVMADPFNLFGVSAVPITLLVDEHGVIRKKNPKSDDLATFLAQEFPKPESAPELVNPNIGPDPRRAIPRAVDTLLKTWSANEDDI